jgi:hypothetical protein
VAALAMTVIFLEVFLGRVSSWGIYLALVFCAAGYFTSDMVTSKFGGYFQTPEEQATRRRFAIIPTLFVFYRGTDFRRNVFDAVVLGAALIIVASLVLVPEPRE